MSEESPRPQDLKKKKTSLKKLYGMWKEKNLTSRNTVGMLETDYHVGITDSSCSPSVVHKSLTRISWGAFFKVQIPMPHT